LSFTTANILSSFKNTGVIPMDPDMILRKFKSATPEQDQSSNLYEVEASSSWKQVHGLIVSAVKDTRSKEAKQLSNTFHSLQTQSELDRHENTGLKAALDTKKKRKEKMYTLDFGEPREDTGGAMFFTPSKVKEAQFIQRMKEQDQEAETLRKAEAKQNKAEATALKKKEKEETKVAREEAKKVRQVKASELAAARAQKEAEAIAAKAQKATNLSTKGLSIPSQNSRARPKSKRGASQLQGAEDHGEGPSEPAPKASRTWTIRAPERYSE
jgi:hypothetical protein